MANKMQFYAQMAEDAARQITGSREQWTSFLRTAARLYKYPYHEQLMIFAQRPDATACAEYDLWNDTMHRYVRRGSKGIALIDTRGDRPRLRYVFDVSDTGERRNSRPVQLWQMKEEYRELIMMALEQAFEVSREGQSLESMIYAAAERLASDYWDNYSRQILDIVEDSYLAGYDGFETGVAFRRAAATSIAYCLYSRCTDDPDAYFEHEDFLDIFDFNTRQAANTLGTAVSSLSAQIFREIEVTTRNYERVKVTEKALEEERRREDASALSVSDTIGEGSENHDEGSNLHEEGGLSDPGHSDGNDRGAASWEVRQDAQGVPGGEQSDAVKRSDSVGETVSASLGDPADSHRTDGSADDAVSAEGSGTGQEDRSDGLDTAYEQPESTGGGDRDSGTYHQLSFTDLIPSETEQIQRIDTAAEMAESEKPSAFSISDDEVNRVLQNGSGFANGKIRIQTLYASEHDPKIRADYLKNEYGLGGRSWTFSDGSRGFVDYSGKGMLIRSYEHDVERRLRWPEVEKRLDALFRDGRYLSEQEQTEYDRLQEDYAGFGGIPLPSPAHGFPSIEDLTRKRNEAELEATQDAGQGDLMGIPEEITQKEVLSGTEAGQTQGEVTTETDSQPEVQSELQGDISSAEEGVQSDIVSTEGDLTEDLLGINFHITDDHLGEGGPKEKFARNIAAIETLFTLEAENRNATPEEQEILSRYVGWGGLADAFDPNKDNWAKEYAQLKTLLPEQEYEMARASTLNAHYTSPTVIKAIYDGLEQMGFKSGNILEPSMGIGNFFGMLPEAMQDSRLYGVELDPITGRIAQKLYPEAEITVAGFETTDSRDFYDLAVGNVPFGNYRVSDKPYDRLGFSIHNYFFAKALDQVRPGGIVAFVTSRYTMDQQSPEIRKYLAQRAELLGAIRLPNNAFRANAGTDVVSDIIFLQKRDHPIDIEPDWVHLGQTPEGLTLNSYFVDHPEMVLGQLTTERTQYGKQESTVLPIPGVELSEQLKEAVSHIHGSYAPQAITEQDFGDVPDSIPADPNVKNFSYTVVSGEVFFRENSVMRPVDLNEKMKGRVKGLVALRQIVNELIEYQMGDYEAYRKSGYSKKVFEEHRAEITLHKAAKEAFNAAGAAKLPTIKELRHEYAQLIGQKKEAYKGYREAKREMQELLKARQNVEQFYGDDLKKEREQARNLKKDL